MSSAVWADQRYCCPRLAKVPVSGSTEPIRTSLTFAARADGKPTSAPMMTTASTMIVTKRRRIGILPAGVASMGAYRIKATAAPWRALGAAPGNQPSAHGAEFSRPFDQPVDLD